MANASGAKSSKGAGAAAAAAGLAAGVFAAGRAGVMLRACCAAMIVLSALTCMPLPPRKTGKIFRDEGCQRLNGLAEGYSTRGWTFLRHIGHGLDKTSSVK